MASAQAFASLIRGRINRISAYIVTLYYLEIVFLMFGLLFLYGKGVAIAAGVILSLLLTYHIIQLFFGKSLHRKLQLCLIDVHAAFAAGYLFYSAVQGIDTSPAALLILVTRSLLLACELPLLICLSGDEGAEAFR
ncbi:MAG: hypothetical protein KA369_12830 [Spirochaetes bacterium]|nr:hypothetical protein [Spirochaetota bacterium]